MPIEVIDIQPVLNADRVDIDITFDDGTKCTYVIPKPGDSHAMVFGDDLSGGRQATALEVGAAWVRGNQARIDELLKR